MSGYLNKLFRKCSRIMQYKYKTFKYMWKDLSKDEKESYRVILETVVEKYEEAEKDPIEIDVDGRIINGHARYQAMIDLGIPASKIPKKVTDRSTFKSKLKDARERGSGTKAD